MFSELSFITVVQTSILCWSNDAIYANLYLPLMNGGLILFFLYTLADSWGGCAQIYHGAGKNPPLLWCFLFAAWTIFVLALGSLRVQRFLGLSTLSRSLNLQLESALGSGKCSAAENRIARGSLKGSFLCTGKKRLSGWEHQLKLGWVSITTWRNATSHWVSVKLYK